MFSSFPALVNTSVVQNLYDNPYTLNITLASIQLCQQTDGMLVDCGFSGVIPSPTFSNNICSNVVVQVMSSNELYYTPTKQMFSVVYWNQHVFPYRHLCVVFVCVQNIINFVCRFQLFTPFGSRIIYPGTYKISVELAVSVKALKVVSSCIM